jgi:HEAT repeat protein
MHSVSSAIWFKNPSEAVFIILGTTAIGILMLLAAILLRRIARSRYLKRRDLRVIWAQKNWEEIVQMKIPPESWISNSLDRGIVEEMLLDRIDSHENGDPAALSLFAKNCGLLNQRTWAVRHCSGSRLRRSLLALGRMRNPEGIPAIGEAMHRKKGRYLVEAIRSLGMIGIPEAAEPILNHLESGIDRCPPQSLHIALAGCFRQASTDLLAKTKGAGDPLRSLLARALAEVATRSTDGDLLPLAADPSPEVRACAARILAAVRPPYARAALIQLALDEEWFVRLRAVVGLGELKDRESIRVLVKTLCDSNRLVRLRAAAALAQLEGEETNIFRLTVETGDRYALQALVSEMERSGRIAEVANTLSNPHQRADREAALRAALRAGADRILLDLWLHHPGREVRMRLGRLLAASGDEALLQYLDQFSLPSGSRHQVRMLQWLIKQLHQTQARGTSGQGAAA